MIRKKKISLLIQKLTHSSLQLAKGDTIKAIKPMRDAFDKVFVEWNKPIKYSPKREVAVNRFSEKTAPLSSFKNCEIKLQREE